MANELEREVRELRQANEILKKGETIFRHWSEDNGRTHISRRRSSSARSANDRVHRRSSWRLWCRADLPGLTLGELIDSITIHHDAERGHTALLEDKLLELLRFGYIKKAASLSTAACSLKLVAGVGFEPTTFRL